MKHEEVRAEFQKAFSGMAALLMPETSAVQAAAQMQVH